MKGRIGQRAFTDHLAADLTAAMDEWAELTGRRYGLIEPYRTEDAERIVVAIGTMADTCLAVVDHLRRQGQRVGCVAITAFRPFPATELATTLGEARAVAVVERTEEPTASWNPLTREVRSALYDRALAGMPVPRLISGSAGLGSRDVAAGDLAAVFETLADPGSMEKHERFVLGIRHPLALEAPPLEIRPAGAYSVRGYSVGGFGSVTTNKLVATLCGDLFGLQVQAYPRYGSEKKGLPTTYFLTVADEPIRGHSELTEVDLVPVHDAAAFRHGAPLAGLVDGGTVFLQSALRDPEAIWASLPAPARAEILARQIRLTAMDSAELARRHAPRPDLTVRMQGVALVGVFLRLAPYAARRGLDDEHLFAALREVLVRYLGKRGTGVVDANLALIREAYASIIDVTAAISSPTARQDGSGSRRPRPSGLPQEVTA
jgi:pyruvate-ferredoxin/flavodoxin oxidoreductase